MATIKVMNASQVNPEAPVQIKLGVVNEPDKPIQYVGIPGPQGKPGKDGATGPRGPKGDTPVKGVDYFTPQDIAAIANQVPVPEVDLSTYATKAEVETAIRGAETGLLKRSIVEELPVNNIDDNTIYMVPKTGSLNDVYNEYLYVNSNWEHIGSTDVDLTGYATEEYVDSTIANIKRKFVIKTHPIQISSPSVVIDEFPQELKDRLWQWLSSITYFSSGGVNYDAYSGGEETFEVYVNDTKISHIVIQEKTVINTFWSLIFIDMSPSASGYYSATQKELDILNPRVLLSIRKPNNNNDWATEGGTGDTAGGLSYGTSARHIYLSYSVDNCHDVESVLRRKQNLLTAGTGITLSGSTISVNTQYLTNSDILAIWNGEDN